MGREPEQALIVEPAEEEAEPLVEVVAGGEPACGEDKAPEPGEPPTVEVSLVAEKLNPPVYRMERVPVFPGEVPPRADRTLSGVGRKPRLVETASRAALAGAGA